jgi:hypothetical protein
MAAEHVPERRTPGPKKDERDSVDFKVDNDVRDVLLALQAETSLRTADCAAMILHLAVRSPSTLEARLAALIPLMEKAQLTRLASRKRQAS